MALTKDLKEFVECLNKNEVEYLIVGALAVSWHGYPRYSADIDLFVRPNSENAGRVDGHLDGIAVSIIGRAELIRNKAATGRTKDLLDLDELRKQP